MALLVTLVNPERDSGPAFLRALKDHADSHGRKLTAFTTDEALRGACERAGFARSGGFLAVLLDREATFDSPWFVSGGDRS